MNKRDPIIPLPPPILFSSFYTWSRLHHYWSNVHQRDHRSGCLLKRLKVFRIIRESPGWGTNLRVSRRGYQIARKKRKKHFEPFYISKTLLNCVSAPDWNNFSFSNSFHRFLMHLYILDSPKDTSWTRVGAFLWGRRANSGRCVLGCSRWWTGVIRVTKIPTL